MSRSALTVILLTVSSAPFALGGRDLRRAPFEDDVRTIVGDVLSYDAETLVLLSLQGERWRFDLGSATETPEPLVSGARVQVEYVEAGAELRALNVVPAPRPRSRGKLRVKVCKLHARRAATARSSR